MSKLTEFLFGVCPNCDENGEAAQEATAKRFLAEQGCEKWREQYEREHALRVDAEARLLFYEPAPCPPLEQRNHPTWRPENPQ